jgi:hypothetical protein
VAPKTRANFVVLPPSSSTIAANDKTAAELEKAAANSALPFAHYYLGVLRRQLGQLELACVEFEKEIAITPPIAARTRRLVKFGSKTIRVQPSPFSKRHCLQP